MHGWPTNESKYYTIIKGNGNGIFEMDARNEKCQPTCRRPKQATAKSTQCQNFRVLVILANSIFSVAKKQNA